MSPASTYYVTVAGEERGPYPVELIRELHTHGLTAPDSTCREAASGLVAPLSSLVGESFEPAASATVALPVRFGPWYASSRNSYHLHGSGSVVADGDTLRLGERAGGAAVTLPYARLRDVCVQGNTVSMTVDGESVGTRAAPLKLWLRNQDEARALKRALPSRVDPATARAISEAVEFEGRLALRPKMRAVPVFVGLNVALYLLLAASGAGWWSADPTALVRHGSNFGPLTADGQWWRLVSSQFLHAGLLHLLVNMAALYDVGRITERLYGTPRFTVLYLVSGILGSAASVWWNPAVNSVGASGAVFGVLGATLVYMLDRRNGVPLSVMKAHQGTMALFILYTFAFGLAQSGIDNAAHLGGLTGGLLLGAALARPLQGIPRRNVGAPAAAMALVAVAVASLLFHTPNTRPAYELDQRFVADLDWLRSEEALLVSQTRDLFVEARDRGTPAGHRERLRELVGRWDGAYRRISAYRLPSSSRMKGTHDDMVTYLDLRRRAMVVAAEAMESPQNSAARSEEFARLMKQADAAVARIKARNQAARR